MKHFKKLLSLFIVAAMAASLFTQVAFAEPNDGRERPSARFKEGYTGGIGEVEWGDTDWGGFKDIDWTGAEEKKADELAAMFDASGFNVITLNSTLTFDSEEGAFYTDADSADETLEGIDYAPGEINFPEGDTIIISTAPQSMVINGIATINIPVNSNVMIINASKGELGPEIAESGTTGIIRAQELAINTNNSGNLALIGFDGDDGSNTVYDCFGLMADNLDVIGGGTVAVMGGSGLTMSVGVYVFESINVDGAALVGTGSGTQSTDSYGILAVGKLDDTHGNCTVTASSGAVVIGVGAQAVSSSIGISTGAIMAREASQVYACAGNVPDDGADPSTLSVGIEIPVSDGMTRRVCVSDGSSIDANGTQGCTSAGIYERYINRWDIDENFEYGKVVFDLDQNAIESPKCITAQGTTAAYMQSVDEEPLASMHNAPAGNFSVIDESNREASFDLSEGTFLMDGMSVKECVIVTGRTFDYTLYYNPADSSFYTDYDNETGVYSNKLDKVTGAEGNGGELTLKNDFSFFTTAPVGLYLPDNTTLIVRENENPVIIAGEPKEDAADRLSAGIVFGDTCDINIDGSLSTSGGCGENISSFGIYSYKDINVTGTGSIYAYGGDITTSVEEAYYSAGIYATNTFDVEKADINAFGGIVTGENETTFTESIGIFTGDYSQSGIQNVNGIIATQDAYITAYGYSAFGSANTYGCVASSVMAVSGASITAMSLGNDCYISAAIGITLLNGAGTVDAYTGGEIICLAEGGRYSFGLTELTDDNAEELDETKQLAIGMDENSSIVCDGDTGAINAHLEPFGSITVKDADENVLTFDETQYGYVNANGELALWAKIYAVPMYSDYSIYYDAEAGFRKNNKDGEALSAEEIPKGMSADGNVLTLDNVVLASTRSGALRIGEGVTVKVPEGKAAYITAVPDAESEMTFAIGGEGGNTLEIDGILLAAACGFNDAANNVVGIFSYDDMTIKGSGQVRAYESNGAGYSYGIMSNKKLIFDGTVSVHACSIAPEVRESNLPICGVAAEGIEMKGESHLSTSQCENSKAIMIMNGGSITVEESSFIEAQGGIVIYGNEQSPGAVLTKDYAIIAAFGKRINFTSSSEDDDTPGITAWVYDAEAGKFEDGKATITAMNYSSVITGGQGSAVWGASAAEGVNVFGYSTAEDYNGELEYDGSTYVVPGTDTPSDTATFISAIQPTDHMLYFDGETGKLYDGYDYETKELGNPIDVPGAACDGKTLTLTSDFKFVTNREDGLYLSPGTTLYVPAGESPMIYSAYSGFDKPEKYTDGAVALYCSSDNTLEIDGNLTVTCGNVRNTNSYGLMAEGVEIKGSGTLTARSGNAVYDEAVGGFDEINDGYSCGIISYGDMSISGTTVNAYAGDSVTGSIGLALNIPTKLTLDGSANVTAVCEVGGEHMGIGCGLHNLEIKDHSSLDASASTSGTKRATGLVIYHDDKGTYGTIRLSNNSSINASATGDTASSYGVEPFEAETSTLNISMDSSSKFTAEGGTAASIYAKFGGVKTTSDGATVSYNNEKQTYVGANGEDVKKLTLGALTSSSTGSYGGGGGGGGGSFNTSGTTPTPAPTEPSSETPTETSAPQTTEELPFTDVAPTDWFYDAVNSAYSKGLVNGISDTEFGPNMTMTRGMLVTIVGRMENAQSSESSFGDVDASQYYAPYVAWAAENGIVTGFEDGTFKPDENVTREQTAAILYRYMQYKGIDVSVGEDTNILSFTDAGDINDYAVPAIQWACGAGVMNGYPDGTLAPAASITRAEFVTMIGRLKV